MNKLKKSLRLNEKNIVFVGVILIIICHSIISTMHFHECDSSDVFRYLSDSSIFSRSHFLRHILKTGFIFSPFRILLGLISSVIPFDFIKSSILLPLKTTYTPLSGFIYGFYIPDAYGKFYEYASLMNILFILSGISFFYYSLKFIGISRTVSFCCSFGILSLYSINAYTYHLGSTVWFIFGSLISISSTIFFHNRFSKYGFCLALLSSYPSLIHFISHVVYIYFHKIYVIKLSQKYFERKIFIKNFFLIIRSYKEALITLAIIIIFFFPFNSGYRTPIDFRGFFTPFSSMPLNSEINLFTYLISITSFIFSFYTIFKRYSNKINFDVVFKNSSSLKFGIDITTLNLIIVFLLVNLEKLSFGTTRHSLFLMPYITFLVAIGIQLMIFDLKKVFYFENLFKIILMSLFIFLSITSLYASYFRFDPLKTQVIPQRIREFASLNNNSITLLDCDFHFTNNDFTEIKASYDLKDSLTNVPLDFLGSRLLVTQTIKEIENFSLNLKKGDELITRFKKVNIKLMQDPYFVENNIFYDSINFDKNSEEYNKRDNPYSRPNNVYIFPINVSPKEGY